MINKILSQFIALFMLELMIFLPVNYVYALGISDVDIADIKDTSATITWVTDEESSSIVHYGIQAPDKKQQLSKLETDHSVILNNLIKGAEYSFIASSCIDNNCVNSSIASFEAGIDIKVPFIDTQIPKFINKKQIDISGKTEPFSSIKLYVNDLNFPIRALDKSETQEGNFEFRNINLQKENVIRLLVTDRAGNKNETTYRVSVDTEDPVFVLDQTPQYTSSKNLSLIGTVDEPVIIKFFLRFGTESKPSKITGLDAVASNNSVQLEWNERKDSEFSHYIVYRKDVGPIALTNPTSYNTYTDLLVNKGQQYTYFVTAVNKFGKESDRSKSATATVTGGRTDISKPQPIDKLIIEKPSLSINTTSAFSESLKLGKDGLYSLFIEVVDRANNRVVVERTVTVDTKKPTIKIISPPSGQLIFENYANEIDIKGITEANSKVHLFIDRSPLKKPDGSFDFSGLPNKISNIPDADLDVDCILNIGSRNLCPKSADYSTDADGSGNFEFENIDLTSIFSGGIGITRIDATDLRDVDKIKDINIRKLLFIATDKVGLRNTKEHRIRIGNCWTGNQSWDVVPLIKHQTPAFISPQRLAENKETINFYMKYEYIGRGEDAEVESVSIRRACRGTEILGDKRFNTSCRIMPSAGNTIVNEDKDVSYTTIRLNRLEGMDRFLGDDWKDFFNSLSNELTFPMKFTITYTHEVDGKKIKEVQTTCQEVTYVMDNYLIDPRNVLPDWVLYDFVDYLQDSIETVNKVKTKVKKVLEFVTVGCAGSFGLRLVFQFLRRFESFGQEKIFQLKDLAAHLVPGTQDLIFDVESEEDQQYCNTITENIKKHYNLEGRKGKDGNILNKFFGIKLSYYSDRDLERCFNSVSKAWDNEAFWYRAYRLTCDRVFGHETPSAWTQYIDDTKLAQKIESGSTCGIDESVRGQPLRAKNCRKLAKDYSIRKPHEIFEDPNQLCFEFKEGNTKTLYQLGKNVGNNIYEAKKKGTGAHTIQVIYVIKSKGSETEYLTYKPETCQEVCNAPKYQKAFEDLTDTERDNLGKNKNQWSCRTTNSCYQVQPKDARVKTAIPSGYTDGCYYQPEKKGLDNKNRVSNDPNKRYECCCILLE